MTLSRREFLNLAGLVAGSTALSACSPVIEILGGNTQLSSWKGLDLGDFHALNRMSFGPTVALRGQFTQIGLSGWIEEQLAFNQIDDLACDLRLRNLDTLKMDADQLFNVSDQLFDNVDKQRVPFELRQAALIRQIYSKRQLYEVMVEFWSDHFNIATNKGDCYYLKTVDDQEVIRAHALGSFRDLLTASAHSPAMLVYLDNQANHKDSPNENYARELMELHTLGVDGGYSQGDVMELARCLTGWTVKEHFWRGQFTFDEEMHDTGKKTVLGVDISPTGQGEGEHVLGILADHPSTARYISTKLARRFIADDVPAELIGKAITTFKRTHGDIQAVLRVILLDGLVYIQPKYKRPVNFVSSALRLLGANTDAGVDIEEYLLRMGQVPFSWPTPDGYPDQDQIWQGNLMPRWQFAFSLVSNGINKTQIKLLEILKAYGSTELPKAVDTVTALLLGTPLKPSLRDDLIKSVLSARIGDEEGALTAITGGIIGSPAFQWR